MKETKNKEEEYNLNDTCHEALDGLEVFLEPVPFMISRGFDVFKAAFQ